VAGSWGASREVVGAGGRRRSDPRCVEGGSGEPGEMAVDDAGEKHI
jgi:hypothetical protein